MIDGLVEFFANCFSIVAGPGRVRNIILGLVGIVIGVGVIVLIGAIVVSNFGVAGPTLDKVRAYCEENNMIVEDDWSQKSSKVSISCHGDTDVSDVYFAIYEKSVIETEDYKNDYSKQLAAATELIGGTTEKAISADDDRVRLQVILDRTYLSIFTKTYDAAYDCLTRMGYPANDGWGSSELWQQMLE